MDTALINEIYDLISGKIRNEDLTPGHEQKAKEILFKDAKVGDISTNHVPTVDQSTKLNKVFPIMKESEYSILPVVDDNKFVVGTIGHSDLVEIFENCSGCKKPGECGVKKHTASEAMNQYLVVKEKLETNEFLYVTSTDSIYHAIQIMNKSKISKLVVVESINNKIVQGILTKGAIKDYLFCFVMEVEKIRNNPIFKELKDSAEKLGNESLYESKDYTPTNMIEDVIKNTRKGRSLRRLLNNTYENQLKEGN